MIQIRRSALVMRTPAVMFDLVNDVEAYPRRFAWCSGAAVLERDESSLVARLDLRLAGLNQSFTTRNTVLRPDRIHMLLVDGPFRTLEGEWSFLALGETGCKIALALDFDYSGRLTAPALRMGFRNLADRLVDDFSREANRVGG
ncbi:MAG: type II toxin-antitoxin system RatA family toxin [Dokdonella sp.]|uniref:type II toxin-antitoxin system RatA family toxin n=2 Tax=Dokdonella sp. TaxID=2291710 RepID=UPI0025BCC3FB|nr:type II toxin-antitoxin system RatA family toxin [Dokdonella sp.]MBK8122368.1 type II toxin-antitoxin system RatA family toxin [Dokdonella sp.]MCC6441501.1 type II toxin-antitoxin system RatA family toxin [Rhodanobacteraceae bacterium]HNV09413.1 type II toxin-antitoxin system RatA family toxin [Dokdonella sp.]HQV47748.1 type II toxin-antitoxin system RatA family toxin [Dokdonella sp.]